jgi:hypothetical protein
MALEVERLQSSPLASSILDLKRMSSLIENFPSHGFDQVEVSSEYHMALTRGISVGRFLLQYDPDKESA